MEIIRTAAPEDAERLLAIYAPYVERTAISFEYLPPSPEEFRERIRTTLERWPWLVVQSGAELLGYIYAGPLGVRRAYQWSCEVSIYLSPAGQGRGLGRRLYERIEDLLRRMGLRSAYVCVAVPEEENDPRLTDNSLRFHRHLGYREVGRFPGSGRKFGRWYGVVWLVKELAPHGEECPEPVPFPALPPEEREAITL